MSRGKLGLCAVRCALGRLGLEDSTQYAAEGCVLVWVRTAEGCALGRLGLERIAEGCALGRLGLERTAEGCALVWSGLQHTAEGCVWSGAHSRRLCAPDQTTR